MNREPYDIQAAVSPTNTSCFRQILNPLFDLYYVLEIITFGNYNGLDAVPLTLLSPYILSLVNANGPTVICFVLKIDGVAYHDIKYKCNTDACNRRYIWFNDQFCIRSKLFVAHAFLVLVNTIRINISQISGIYESNTNLLHLLLNCGTYR